MREGLFHIIVLFDINITYGKVAGLARFRYQGLCCAPLIDDMESNALETAEDSSCLYM